MKRPSISAWLLFCALLLAWLPGCAPKQPGMVRDLEIYPQDAEYYLDEPGRKLISSQRQAELFENFQDRFFVPWHRDKPAFSAQEVFWGIDRFKSRDIYGENNLPLPPGWLEEMELKSRVSSYPSVHIPGISVVHSSMRVLPTNRPVFYNPSSPGEGFPFDYMQNTLLPAGTPVLITHASSDGQWALAETDFAAGWIRWSELAVAGDDFREKYQDNAFAAFLADDVPITGPDGLYLVSGRVGMVLPLAQAQADEEYLRLLVPVRDCRGYAQAAQAMVSKKDVRAMPFVPEAGNFASVLNSMMGQAYGWGGLFENRDCSALLKDVFAGFGIFLPRNSRDQAGAGRFISLEGLSAVEKQDMIVRHGQPWLTILYMPGHVMLYIGQDPGSGRVLIYHSMWGLRTWRPFRADGRWVIGSTVITSLEPGKEMHSLARPHGLLVERLTGMVFPARP
jgi:hypothetical protein